jgi:hypothetical protein
MQHKNGVTEFAADGALPVTDGDLGILQSALEIEEKKHLTGVQQVFQKIIRPFGGEEAKGWSGNQC